jgi:hypothetical protein
VFTNPRKAHRVFDFKDAVFDGEPNVKTAVSKIETAYQNRLQTYKIENTKGFIDMDQFLDNIERDVVGLIRKEMVVKEVTKVKKKRKRPLRTKRITNRELKVNIVVRAEFERPGEEFDQKNFKTANVILTVASDLAEFYSEAKTKILNEMEEMEIKGSNWTLNRILNLELRIN